MCGRKLKMLFVLLGLLLLFFFAPLCSFCYADVRLTDQEAKELMTEIQESKKDLENLQIQLEDVKNTYSEQKKSYEMQLNEAEEKNQKLQTAVTITSSTTATLIVALVIVLLL